MVPKHLVRYKTILWYQSISRIIKQFYGTKAFGAL